jgi:hypothetical protein
LLEKTAISVALAGPNGASNIFATQADAIAQNTCGTVPKRTMKVFPPAPLEQRNRRVELCRRRAFGPNVGLSHGPFRVFVTAMSASKSSISWPRPTHDNDKRF